MRLKRAIAATVIVVAGLMPAVGVKAQNQGLFNERLLEAFTYRNLGPFRMQVRIADIDVPASPAKDHLYTMYVAPWIGGLFKTTNNGTTCAPRGLEEEGAPEVAAEGTSSISGRRSESTRLLWNLTAGSSLRAHASRRCRAGLWARRPRSSGSPRP